MNRPLASFLALSLLVAACSGGGDDDDDGASGTPTPSPSPSATAAGPFACIGQPLPTVAGDPIVVSGNATSVSSGGSAPVNGATISAFRTGNGTALALDTSDAAGAFSMSVPTGTTPIDGYLRGQAAGFLDTYVYAANPAYESATQDVVFISAATRDQLVFLASVTQSAGNGLLPVFVLDCNGNPVAGATISLTPSSGTIRYASGGLPSTSATATDATGAAFIFNVTPGTVTIDGQLTGQSFREHAILVRADVITGTSVAPGPN